MSVNIRDSFDLDWSEMTEAERYSSRMATDDLLLGSEILDRKKEEIKRVVSSLVALLNHSGGSASNTYKFEAPNFEWWVFTPKKRDVQIAARIRWRGVGGPAYSSDRPDEISHRHIEKVREYLPLLVAGLLRTHPDLTERIEPFMAAAHNSRVVAPNPLGEPPLPGGCAPDAPGF